jgi:hypothetical protein
MDANVRLTSSTLAIDAPVRGSLCPARPTAWTCVQVPKDGFLCRMSRANARNWTTTSSASSRGVPLPRPRAFLRRLRISSTRAIAPGATGFIDTTGDPRFTIREKAELSGVDLNHVGDSALQNRAA